MSSVKVALYSLGYYSEFVSNDELYRLFGTLMEQNNSHLLARLYKKYVKEEDLNPTLCLLKKLKGKTRNDKNLLKELISKFEYATQSSVYFKNKYGHYDAVRFVLLDEPYCTLSRNIPLEDYDNNDGEPFWMRPQYILDHYSQTCGDYKYKD